jgi:hypothetical protein
MDSLRSKRSSHRHTVIHRPRLVIRIASFAAAALLAAACGGPSAPTPVPPPANAAPVITSLSLSRARLEVGESVEVTATIVDAESTVGQLQLIWTSDAGQFTGQGTTVTWKPNATIATPADSILTVTVVEPYQALDAQGRLVTREHRVAGSTSLRVHDSRRELGNLGLTFLRRFATSSIAPEACVADFSDNCRGKREEREDIEFNRTHFVILSSEFGAPNFTRLDLYTGAEMLIPCAFESRYIKCPPGTACAVGSISRVRGDCRLTAVYEQSRWWLCMSNFLNGSSYLSPAMRAFFGRDTEW